MLPHIHPAAQAALEKERIWREEQARIAAERQRLEAVCILSASEWKKDRKIAGVLERVSSWNEALMRPHILS